MDDPVNKMAMHAEINNHIMASHNVQLKGKQVICQLNILAQLFFELCETTRSPNPMIGLKCGSC